MKKISQLCALIILPLTLNTGCASNGGGMSHTTKGMLLGATAGALLGKSTGNHKDKRMLIGAVISGLAGAAIGSYMDQQERDLRQELERTDVNVTRTGNYIMLSLPDRISFGVNRSDLKPELRPVLADIVNVLHKYDQTLINVRGHTDDRGSAQYNQILSEKRAWAVTHYLQANGLASHRITTRGFGETLPVASNNTEYGRAENRRVELLLTPLAR